MNKTIYLRSLHKLYYYLLSMTDDEIARFDINNSKDRRLLFSDMRSQFNGYASITKDSIIDTLEYLCTQKECENHWRYIIPHEVPLDEVEDKADYAHTLFAALADRAPELNPTDTFTLSYDLAPREPAH